MPTLQYLPTRLQQISDQLILVPLTILPNFIDGLREQKIPRIIKSQQQLIRIVHIRRFFIQILF